MIDSVDAVLKTHAVCKELRDLSVFSVIHVNNKLKSDLLSSISGELVITLSLRAAKPTGASIGLPSKS